jgi:hypothetical protein
LTGPAGATGAAGTNGATGPAGAAGATGATGATGPQGPIGLTGPAGANGATGSQGPIGLTGATGATGPQGPIGLTGATGAAGTNGATGPQGPIGLTGPAGAAGIEGGGLFTVSSLGFNYFVSGLAGSFPTLTLVRGQLYYFNWSAVSSSHPIALRLANGNTAAVPGTTNNNPTTGQHSTNTLTFYRVPLDAPSSIVYQCVFHSSMIGTINIVNQNGADGATGPQGPIGLTGAAGAAGATGATGPQGPAGLTGATGATGPQGIQGPAGTYTAGTGILINNNEISVNPAALPQQSQGTKIGFSSSGTWTCPANVTQITIELWGAGGGCSGYLTNPYFTNNYIYPENGGNGGYLRSTITVIPNTNYSIVIGSGGVNGAQNTGYGNVCANSGTPGGNSSFNNTLISSGGGGRSGSCYNFTGGGSFMSSPSATPASGSIINYPPQYPSRSYIPDYYLVNRPNATAKGAYYNWGVGVVNSEDGFCIISY